MSFTDLEFKVKKRCTKAGTKIKLKGDHNSYIYLGLENVENENGEYCVKRVLKVDTNGDQYLKIISNEEFFQNVYLDLSCLNNLKSLKKDISKNDKRFDEIYTSFLEVYPQISDRFDKETISNIYRDYESNFKKEILGQIEGCFIENKEEIGFIANLALDMVFDSFYFYVLMNGERIK